MTAPDRRRRLPAAAYVHGVDGPFALVPAWACLWLEQQTNLARRRVELRGVDPAIDDVLVALRATAMRWDPTASAPASSSGSEVDPAPEVTGPSSCVAPMGAGEAAARSGISTRAVRLACESGRLKAQKVGGRWLIDPQDLNDYRAARAA